MAPSEQGVVLSSIFADAQYHRLKRPRRSRVLRRGEIHALLGSGAGKSTLMNILSGVYLPDSGEIYIEGEKAGVSFSHGMRSVAALGWSTSISSW